MSVTKILTDKENELIEHGRRLKESGHGTLTVEYRNGEEVQFVPAPKLIPLASVAAPKTR